MKLHAVQNTYTTNSQRSFGRFYFKDNKAIEYLQKNVTKKTQVDEFRKTCNVEALRQRLIPISSTEPELGELRLSAIFKGETFNQGLYESPLRYLKELTRKADKVELDILENWAKEKDINHNNAQEVKNIALNAEFTTSKIS